jgi:hypothetical protein
MVEQFGREDIGIERQRLGYSQDLNTEIGIQENLAKALVGQYQALGDSMKKSVNDSKNLVEVIKQQLEALKDNEKSGLRFAELQEKINKAQNLYKVGLEKSKDIQSKLSTDGQKAAQQYVDGLTARYKITEEIAELEAKQNEAKILEKDLARGLNGVTATAVQNAQEDALSQQAKVDILNEQLKAVSDINDGSFTSLQNITDEDKLLLQKLAKYQKQMDIGRNIITNHGKEFDALNKNLGSWDKLTGKVEFYNKKLRDSPIFGGAFKFLDNQLENIGISFKKILENVLKFDSLVTNLSKSLQISKDGARTVSEGFLTAADNVSNINKNVDSVLASVKNQVEANNQLNEALGTGALFTAKSRLDQIEIVKGMGLQAAEGAKLYGLGKLNQQSAHDVNVEVGNQVVNLRKATGITLDYRKVLSDVAKVGGQLSAQYSNDPKRIAEAVIQVQKLGLSFEQAAKMANSLLSFETSIENELKAELLTGKALNLEQARELALRGETAKAAQELVNQVGSLEEFQNLNVIQQKSLAESIGLSADEMADMLKQQKLLAGTTLESKAAFEEMAREAGRTGDYSKLNAELAQAQNGEQLVAQATQISNQERFNSLVENLQERIAILANGPLGTMMDKFAKLVSSANTLKGIIVAIGTIIAVKMVGGLVDMALKLAPVLVQFGGVAAEAALTTSFLTVGTGILVALAAAGVAYAAINAASGGETNIAAPSGGGGVGGINVPTSNNNNKEINVYVKSESTINQNGQQIGKSATQYQKQSYSSNWV